MTRSRTMPNRARILSPSLWFAIPVVIILVVAALWWRPAAPSNGLLATVNDQPITVDDLHLYQSRHPAIAQDPTQLLETLITREALAQQARELGIADTPEFRAALQSLLITHLRERELQSAIAAIEIPEAALQEAYDNAKADLH